MDILQVQGRLPREEVWWNLSLVHMVAHLRISLYLAEACRHTVRDVVPPLHWAHLWRVVQSVVEFMLFHRLDVMTLPIYNLPESIMSQMLHIGNISSPGGR